MKQKRKPSPSGARIIRDMTRAGASSGMILHALRRALKSCRTGQARGAMQRAMTSVSERAFLQRERARHAASSVLAPRRSGPLALVAAGQRALASMTDHLRKAESDALDAIAHYKSLRVKYLGLATNADSRLYIRVGRRSAGVAFEIWRTDEEQEEVFTDGTEGTNARVVEMRWQTKFGRRSK